MKQVLLSVCVFLGGVGVVALLIVIFVFMFVFFA